MKAKLLFLAPLFFLTSCSALQTPKQSTSAIEARYTPASYASLEGWSRDDLNGVGQALVRSCQRMVQRDPNAIIAPEAIAGRAVEWQAPCRAILAAPASQLRQTIEAQFVPHRVTTTQDATGLFTGYYEKELKGSLVKTDRYTVPLHKRPPELVMVELGEFRPHLKGERIAGQVIDGRLKPFADRAQIENGSLAGRNLELAWVDDADAAFFLHIQGSGRVQLENGQTLRVGYDGQNGHVYHAIGKELIARGVLTPETTSLQTIRAWLKANPDQAAALRHKNPSYIFFRQLTEEGPVGAQGVALTPMRSLAVDPRFIPYTAPVWVDIAPPEANMPRLQRLMIAQDTGGAIRGAVRGDFFWGAGPRAEELAGIMKSSGAYWVLLPKTISGAKTIRIP